MVEYFSLQLIAAGFRERMDLFRLFFLVLAMADLAVAAEPRFIGAATFSSDATDLSPVEKQLGGDIPSNRLGSHGSGIAWTGKGNVYAMVADRGPADGATAYRCRYHLVEVSIDESSKTPVGIRLVETHLLSDRSGNPLTGALSAIPKTGDSHAVRFDPEAIRVTPQGTLFISDEYGPSIVEFSAAGRQIREVPIPSKFLITKPAADPKEELPPNNLKGRQPNRGLECLAISPKGDMIYALLQGPLIQDGALDEENRRIGTNVRLLEIQQSTGATRELLYQLNNPTLGCNEIEYIAPGRFLVIERDGKPGTEAASKLIYEIDIRNATDISGIASLPSRATPDGVAPIVKRLFLDLLDPRLSLAGSDFPEKIEGLAIGPKLSDGSRVLLVTSDNDFLPGQATHIYAFAIQPE